jgi:hypothetical protein
MEPPDGLHPQLLQSSPGTPHRSWMAVAYADVQYPDGSRYSGTCLPDQTPHGYGTLVSLTSTYIGSWVNGLRTGYGTFSSRTTFPGEVIQYEGGFKNGYYHGDGTATYMISPNPMGYDYHVSYSGGWEAGQWSGRGRIKYASGTEYEGGINMGMKDGYGVMSLADGRRYEGGWKNDHKDGYCVEIDVNGQKYEGGIHGDNNIHGYGHKNWSDQTSYDGGWKDGRKYGYGSESAIGYAYDGGVKDGLRTGYGQSFTTGGVYDGGWKDNNAEGYGVTTYPNGCQVEGAWHQGEQVL